MLLGVYYIQRALITYPSAQDPGRPVQSRPHPFQKPGYVTILRSAVTSHWRKGALKTGILNPYRGHTLTNVSLTRSLMFELGLGLGLGLQWGDLAHVEHNWVSRPTVSLLARTLTSSRIAITTDNRAAGRLLRSYYFSASLPSPLFPQWEVKLFQAIEIESYCINSQSHGESPVFSFWRVYNINDHNNGYDGM